MATTEVIRVDGLRELDDRLKTLPERLAKGIVAGGLRAGARLILAKAKQNARRQGGSGTLYRAIVLARDRNAKPLMPMYAIYTRRGKSYQAGNRQGRRGSNRRANRNNMDAFYAAWVEKGTRPHIIKARNAKSLAFIRTGGGGMNFRRKVHHPGAIAKPFLEPAYEDQRDAALERVKTYIRDRLDQAAGAP